MATASLASRTPWCVLVIFFVLAAASMPASAQCTFATSFGSGVVNPSGAVTTLSTCTFAGEHTPVGGAMNGETLRFSSSVGTDFVTVRSGTFNGPVVAFGASPLLITSTSADTLYAHWSSNASCGTETSCRATTVQLAPQCLFGDAFGNKPIDLTGNVVQFSDCSYAGDYSTVTGTLSGQKLRFTSSVATDFIVVRGGSRDGPIVASGRTPLVFVNTVNGPLFAHWSKNSTCGREQTCRVTTVQLILEPIFRNGFE